MSELAEAYYQERADRLEIDEVPEILNGVPVRLMHEDYRLSLQLPDRALVRTVSSNYRRTLGTLDNFVIQAYQRTKIDAPFGIPFRQQQTNERHVSTVIERRLFPGFL